MNYLDQFTSSDVITLTVILAALVCFIIYWFVYISPTVKKRFFDRYPIGIAGSVHIQFTKYFGFVMMGIVPFLIAIIAFPQYDAEALGLRFSTESLGENLKWIFGLGLPIVIINYFNTRKKVSQNNYPQIRVNEWTSSLMSQYGLAWFFYLLGYEFLFRGFLLFPLVDTLGIWPAIAINISFYSATHIPKGMDETIGAIILGAVLCLLTLQTQTIWIAVWIHVILAWSNSFFAFYHNPEMKFVNRK